MRRNTRKRSKTTRRAIAAVAATALGAGGLVAANVYASAGESRGGNSTKSSLRDQTNQAIAAGAAATSAIQGGAFAEAA